MMPSLIAAELLAFPPLDELDLQSEVIEDPLHHEVHEVRDLLGLVIEPGRRGSTIAPASVASVRLRRCTSESGVSRGTRISVRRSLSMTSAVRSISERLRPCAIAATVPNEHWQITLPVLPAEPQGRDAPRILSSYTRTPAHSP